MKQITILGLHNTIATTVSGPMDVFFQAGQLWNHIHGMPLTPYFNVEIVSWDGHPVKCLNNLRLSPHRAMDEVDRSDLIIIPSISGIDRSIAHSGPIIEWLRFHHERGAAVASVCTGAFLLAETGLLDGRTATTHWGFVDQFRKRYPRVRLKPQRLITDEETLFCAGALAAGIDLSIYLVEKYCGHEVAVQCAKALLHDMGRTSQAPYSVFRFQKNHADDAIKASQQWIEANYPREVDLNHLATRHGMSRRTFERRFKRATGDTPLFYLQRTRVEAAKRLLEKGYDSFESICHQLGYENSGHFREVFRKHTGLLPTAYQKHFQSQ